MTLYYLHGSGGPVLVSMRQPLSILIIDDDPDDLTVLQSILAGAERWNMVVARSAVEALPLT